MLGIQRSGPEHSPRKRGVHNPHRGRRFTCGLRVDQTIGCWGRETTPPAGQFTRIAAGLYHACGLRTDGTAACWGQDTDGAATPLAGVFIDIAGGWDHTCGLRSDLTVECWGNNDHGQALAVRFGPRSADYQSISALPQVKPEPNATIATFIPRSRPPRASTSASNIGIVAAVVFP